MIHYSLVCEKSHKFDGWFSNAAAYESQKTRGLVTCPICLTNAKDLAFGCGHMVSNVQIQTFYVLSIATIVTMQMQLTEGNKMKKNKP